tara:strand:+ start:4449 stop:5264 length:816 start_codon:yes stop_codon:yes gene_type:complete
MSLTLVTALYDIDRKGLGDGRSFDEYLSWFAETLKVKSPMVIFVEDSLKQFVQKHRKNLPTKIIVQSLDKIPYYHLNSEIHEILDSEIYKKKISVPSRIECKMCLYNVIIFSKFPWVKRVIEENPFGSEYFMWMDAGLSRFFEPHQVNINQPYPSESAIESLLDNKDSVLIQASMSFYPDLVNADEYSDEYFWNARSWVMAGLWGGGSEVLSKFCDMIDVVLNEKLIRQGMINNEQIVMAYVYKMNSDMFTVFENYAHLHRQYEIIAELQK